MTNIMDPSDNFECSGESESPFTNHLILLKIEKHLSLDELRAARSVNSLWFTIFSRRLTLKIPDKAKFKEFIEFYLNEENELEIPLRSFNFDNNYWRLNNFSIIAAELWNQLMQICPVKKLILPEIKSVSIFKSILETVGPTLEYLEFSLSLFEFRSNNENELNYLFGKTEALSQLPKLQHIFIKLQKSSPAQPPIYPFLQDLLRASSSSLMELSIAGITTNFVHYLIMQDFSNLRILNIFSSNNDNWRSDGSLSALTEFVKKHQLEKIVVLDKILNWRTFENFLKKLPGNYDKGNLIEQNIEKLYWKLQKLKFNVKKINIK